MGPTTAFDSIGDTHGMTKSSIGRVVLGLWMVFVTVLAGLPLATRVSSPAAAPQAIQAPSGAVVPVQLRLTDSSGPLNGTYSLILQLYSAASGGTLLLQETKSATLVNGLTSVMIGETPNFGTITATFANTNGTVWLGVSVQGGAELTPRVQVGAAPFALNVPDGAIGNAKLGTNLDGSKLQVTSVANDKLASGIDAAKVTLGSMSGDRVTVNTLNGDRIAPSTLFWRRQSDLCHHRYNPRWDWNVHRRDRWSI